MGKKKSAHHRVWKELKASGDLHECFWCEMPFNEKRPPTVDHVQPKSFGGHRIHGFVFACGPCNSARGNIPFDAYLEACAVERQMARLEKREFRRPKKRLIAGRWMVTTMTKRMIREAEALAAVDAIAWIEPSDVLADKRWDREVATRSLG